MLHRRYLFYMVAPFSIKLDVGQSSQEFACPCARVMVQEGMGPSKLAHPMGIEPTSPGLDPGVLSRLNYGTVRESAQTSSADSRMRFCCRSRQSQMGKWRDRTEALHAGNRTRTAKAFATDGTPS